MCAFIHGFEPYFYIEEPLMVKQMGNEGLEDLKNALNVSGGQWW